jgi:serine protease Do
VTRFLTAHFAWIVTTLIAVNLVVALFLLVGVGWQQLSSVPARIYQVAQESEPLARTDTAKDKPNTARPMMAVAGVIDDPNVKLVCADETFAAAVSRVRPAVVNISCESVERSSDGQGVLRFDDPAQDLATFGGIGSGVVVDGRGFVLTSYHVVRNASNILVTPFGPEAQRYRARIVARDENLNLAVLRLLGVSALPEATIGSSAAMEVADVVLAVGSPFGLEQSVTHGIISDSERDLLIEGMLYREMMQTDVAINRGSSGGPLINVNGEVIGINMAIYSPTGVYNGVSFALPIDRAQEFLAKALP